VGPLHFLESCRRRRRGGDRHRQRGRSEGAEAAWIIAHAKRTEFGQFPGRDTVRPQAGVDCAEALYKKAGITNPRKQIDCAEIYVPFSWYEPMWLEGHLIAPEGDGWKMTDQGVTEIGGDFPVNMSGGVLSSNPIGASGLIRCLEAANQVRARLANTKSGARWRWPRHRRGPVLRYVDRELGVAARFA
jgi:acetyl-CoA C-acetyltransferase